MRYARVLLATLSALCFAAAAHAQQAQVCTLTAGQAPELRGFRLGMTTEQLKARVPGILVQQQEFGASRAVLSSVNFMNLDAAAYRGVSEIYFSFVDDRLVSFSVNYQGVPWKGPDQFAEKVSESLKLPAAWHSQNGSEVLTCDGFKVTASAYPTAIMLSAPGYAEVIKRRREQYEEKLRQDFRP
jgi:hypothetical protein